jgi:uncharacterized protein YgbK (DUF1537 family)
MSDSDCNEKGVLMTAALRRFPGPRSDLAPVQRLVARSQRKIVVLDDDPTGTQTVHGIDVLTEWSESALAAALVDPRPCFFILTNSRSLPEAEATALVRELATNLSAAAAKTKQEYTIISRSDSTLRGHFPAETDELQAIDPAGYDGVIIAPAFFEAGRLTVDDVHYVTEGERMMPAAETEFAQDATFGYRHSDLREWIQEKTGGRVAASEVVSISLETLRTSGAVESVRDRLLGAPRGAYVVVNAAAYGDLETFVHGLLLAEAAGRRFLARTAASFVRVRAGVEPHPLLDRAALRAEEGRGGLVVIGSYTAKTTAQMEPVLTRAASLAFELNVGRLAAPDGKAEETRRLKPLIEAALKEDRTAIVFTSRAKKTALGMAGDLNTGRAVSEALVNLVRSLDVRPRFVVAKGGITSSDIAVRALGVRRARILGQIEPGIPVWRTGGESRWSGIAYVVFPGNVGDPGTLGRVLEKTGG